MVEDSPTPPEGWESSWEQWVGSPRFEEARQTCGMKLADLRKPSGLPANRNLEEEVARQLEERREKRRMFELRTVVVERQRLINASTSDDTSSVDWAAKMREQNKARIALLREQAIKANEVQQRRTCFELAKSLAMETRAQAMADDAQAREVKQLQREEVRAKAVKERQLELKQQRIQMEADKEVAMQMQEEVLVRRLYQFKQAEEAREAMQRRRLEELKRQAKLREAARLEAQKHHQQKQKTQLEEVRQQTLRRHEAKEARTLQWQLNEARRHAEALKQSREAESGVGKRLAEAIEKQADAQLEEQRKATARREAADERHRRQEQQKMEALSAKRELSLARMMRNQQLLRSIRTAAQSQTGPRRTAHTAARRPPAPPRLGA